MRTQLQQGWFPFCTVSRGIWVPNRPLCHIWVSWGTARRCVAFLSHKQHMWEFSWEAQEQGMAMSHQDCPPHLMCWSGVQIKQKPKVAQRARSSQNTSLYGLQIIPDTANLNMWAQACPYSWMFITTFQFSRIRAGIWIIKEESSRKNKTKTNPNPTHFQTSIHEAGELTLIMMMITMMFLDGTCCLFLQQSWNLLYASSSHAFLFPWQTRKILITASASIAVLSISLCRWRCVWTSFSIYYLPCPW